MVDRGEVGTKGSVPEKGKSPGGIVLAPSRELACSLGLRGEDLMSMY